MEWVSSLLGLLYLHNEGCGGSAGCYAFPLGPASYKQCLNSSRVLFEMVPGGRGGFVVECSREVCGWWWSIGSRYGVGVAEPLVGPWCKHSSLLHSCIC
jgi:hypothetical protein